MSRPVAGSRRIIVCATQVPFLEGGAEAHTRGLVDQLRRRGHRAEQVMLPFKWYPPREILAHAAAWRLLDLSESAGGPIAACFTARRRWPVAGGDRRWPAGVARTGQAVWASSRRPSAPTA